MLTLDILRKYKVRPKKSFGQNFLINENVLDEIVPAAGINEDDLVIEIGAGIGNLTQRLVKASKKLAVVESDQNMQLILADRFGKEKNIDFLFEDALKINYPELFKASGLKNYYFIGNIPYSITGILLRTITELEPAPRKLFFMVQEEVAERIIANPPQMNLLGLAMQLSGDVKLEVHVPKDDFSPSPKVDSALISWESKQNRKFEWEKDILRLAKYGFSQKRKKLTNSLAAGLRIETEDVKSLLEDSGIDQNTRAQNLNIDDWARLLEQTKNLK